MITLIRWCILNYKRVKIKLAFYSYVDQFLNEFKKNPDIIRNFIEDNYSDVLIDRLNKIKDDEDNKDN